MVVFDKYTPLPPPPTPVCPGSERTPVAPSRRRILRSNASVYEFWTEMNPRSGKYLRLPCSVCFIGGTTAEETSGWRRVDSGENGNVDKPVDEMNWECERDGSSYKT
ncbi:hypothetical protein U1Q18_003730 [Sarracenia purpurea var. burkii]